MRRESRACNSGLRSREIPGTERADHVLSSLFFFFFFVALFLVVLIPAWTEFFGPLPVLSSSPYFPQSSRASLFSPFPSCTYTRQHSSRELLEVFALHEATRVFVSPLSSCGSKQKVTEVCVSRRHMCLPLSRIENFLNQLRQGRLKEIFSPSLVSVDVLILQLRLLSVCE